MASNSKCLPSLQTPNCTDPQESRETKTICQALVSPQVELEGGMVSWSAAVSGEGEGLRGGVEVTSTVQLFLGDL